MMNVKLGSQSPVLSKCYFHSPCLGRRQMENVCLACSVSQ